jgi:hypothetical protein
MIRGIQAIATATVDRAGIFHNTSCRFPGQNPQWDIKPIRIAE